MINPAIPLALLCLALVVAGTLDVWRGGRP